MYVYIIANAEYTYMYAVANLLVFCTTFIFVYFNNSKYYMYMWYVCG